MIDPALSFCDVASLPEVVPELLELKIKDNTNLKTINFPQRITSLETLNLSNNKLLSSIVLPDGMTEIQTIDVRLNPLITRERVVQLRTQYPGLVLSDYDASFNAPINQQIVQNVGGQEALVQQREIVKKAYKELAANEDTAHLIAANLPNVETIKEKFMNAAEDMKVFLTQALAELKLIDGQNFRFKTAIEGLGLLVADGSVKGHMGSILESYANYEYKGLPNIRQLFVLAYNLLSGPNVEVQQKEFMIASLMDAKIWSNAKAIFEINGTLEEELQKPNNVVNILCSLMKNNYHTFNLNLDKLLLQEKNSSDKRKALFKLVTEISNDFALARLDKLNPLIEALFMIMRGHNSKGKKKRENGRLLDPTEPNKPACAEGAYLNIMKVLGEIEQTKGIMSAISGVQIKLCDESITSVR